MNDFDIHRVKRLLRLFEKRKITDTVGTFKDHTNSFLIIFSSVNGK